jgi:hypothetical protein
MPNSVQSGDDALKQLYEELLNIFFETIDHEECDPGEYLDMRDKPEFDGAWVEADAVVEAAKASFALAAELEPVNTNLRKAVYMRCIHTFGSSDLAADVSDDAGLVFDAMAMEVENEWIGRMMESYRRGRFPA